MEFAISAVLIFLAVVFVGSAIAGFLDNHPTFLPTLGLVLLVIAALVAIIVIIKKWRPLASREKEPTIEQAYAEAQLANFPPWEDFLRAFRVVLDGYLTSPLPSGLYTTILGVAVARYEEVFVSLPEIGSGHRFATRAFYEQRTYAATQKEKALEHFTRRILEGIPPLH